MQNLTFELTFSNEFIFDISVHFIYFWWKFPRYFMMIKKKCTSPECANSDYCLIVMDFFCKCIINLNMQLSVIMFTQFVSVKSFFMALYKPTKYSSHIFLWSSIELTNFWVVYTKVKRVRSKSSWCRAPAWLERSTMSREISVRFLGIISSQMTSKVLFFWSEDSSASLTENAPLCSKCIPAIRIYFVKKEKDKGIWIKVTFLILLNSICLLVAPQITDERH